MTSVPTPPELTKERLPASHMVCAWVPIANRTSAAPIKLRFNHPGVRSADGFKVFKWFMVEGVGLYGAGFRVAGSGGHAVLLNVTGRMTRWRVLGAAFRGGVVCCSIGGLVEVGYADSDPWSTDRITSLRGSALGSNFSARKCSSTPRVVRTPCLRSLRPWGRMLARVGLEPVTHHR